LDTLAYNPATLYEQDDLVIKAVGVNHGPVPALAFRIEYAGKIIVYSGDTSSRSSTPDGTPLANGGNMVAISEGADLLIYDTAIMDDAPAALPGDAVFFGLHTTPTRIGEVAAQAQVGELLLSHLTPITEPNLAEVKQLIRTQGYQGKMKVARDLMVINLGETGF
jgi:ribonuclease BN (tRNA processing enzyme)